MQAKQVPTNSQKSQLLTPQLVQAEVPSTKNPGLQLAHSLAELQFSQLATEQGSQLVDPATFRLKPVEQAVQVSAVTEQLMQLLMLQLRQLARLEASVCAALHCSQMLLNSQTAHCVTLQATQVPVLLTEKPSLQNPQTLGVVQVPHSAVRHWTQVEPVGEGL